MRRQLALLLCLLSILMSIVTAKAQTNPVIVKLWMHDHPPRVPLDKALIKQFEGLNPNIRVEYNLLPSSEFDSRLATALGAGGGPDLFNSWTGPIGQFHASGVLATADPTALGYTSIGAIQQTYMKGALDGATFGGKLYGLPTEVSNYACYANNRLFNAAGLDPDKDFPKTWEAAITVAQRLTKHDAKGSIIQRGFDLPWNADIATLLTFDPMVNQLGGVLINEQTDPPTIHLNTPQVKQVLAYWRDWANRYHLGGPQYPEVNLDFGQGQIAISCYAGNWAIPWLDQAKMSYSIHPLPRWANAVQNTGSDLYSYYFMVSKFSSPDKQAAAWKLAGYLTSFPARYLQEAGLFQPKLAYVTSDHFKRSQQGQNMKVFVDEFVLSHPHPRIAGFFEVLDVFNRMIQRVVVGQEDIDQVLPEAEMHMNSILKRAAEDAKR
ncbi:MAG: extracellular solute-binding protein [Anaerolineae bacterium]|nr:extracellular solute-binding protein [Anaerolineae bacterium]